MSAGRICVFCGSSVGFDPEFREAAIQVGSRIAECGWGVVYGGGHVGLMGIVADACLQGGGEVIGVIPQSLHDREVAHHGLTELIITKSMHERKARMAELSNAFLALPGGIGTFEELFEILTWKQLGIHEKRIGILNVKGYFDPFGTLLDHAVSSGFVRSEHLKLLQVLSEIDVLVDYLAAPNNVDQTVDTELT